MSRTGDMLAPDFPHGTVDGYRRGCRGSMCAAAIGCRDVYRRYQGDFSFRRLVDAGMTVAEIAAQDEAEREAAAQRDKEAARAQRRAEAAAARAAQAKTRKKAERRERAQRPTIAADVARLHAEGLNDRQIANTINANASYVGNVRRALGLAPIPRPTRHAPSEPKIRHDRRADVARLHAQGLRDDAIATELGLTDAYVGNIRRHLGLPAHRIQRPRRPQPERRRVDRRPDVARLHSQGLTDKQIAEQIGVTHLEVGRLRRDLGLTAHRPPAWRRAPEQLRPHGTHASYARGCRCDDCKTANREYFREWKQKRRAHGVPAEHHGTPYGYQLGCRKRSECPADTSCTDAMLAEERRRRREAGIPEQAPRVAAEPVRAHVRALLDHGMSVHTVAHTAGVSLSGVKTLLYGRSGERKGEYPEHIEASKAARLLAIGGNA